MVRNGQIHHLDGNPTNGTIANLVYLCLNCHEEAGKRGRAARSWSSDLIGRRRDRLVGRIQMERRLQYHGSSGFRDALDALIVMDLRSLSRSRDDEWAEAQTALWSIQSYPAEMGVNARRAILTFLYDLAGDARVGMPSRIADGISRSAIDLLPIRALRSHDDDLSKQDVDLLETAGAIGGDLAYDGALYCGKLQIVEAGGEILWRVLSYAKTRSLRNLHKLANEYFELAFDGARRSALPNAVELLQLFKKHGASGNWRRVNLPDEFLRTMAEDDS